MDSETLARLERLADWTEIVECLNRYARGMDRLDRELARSAYHEDAVDDHWGFVGSVDEFLDWAFAYHMPQLRHQHYVTNHNIEIDGDQAHAETYFVFIATEQDSSEPLRFFGGRYVDRLERRDGRWAIAARLCVPEWMTESEELSNRIQLIHPHEPENTVVARDRTDVSYTRPLKRSGHAPFG